MRRLAALATIFATSALGTSVLADPAALVIGNAEYGRADAPDAEIAADVAERLRRAGYDVTLGIDADGDEMRALLSDFADAVDDVDGSDAAVVVLAGRFSHVGGDVALRASGRGQPDIADHVDGLSASLLAQILGEATGDGPRLLVLAGEAEETGRNSRRRDVVARGIGDGPDAPVPVLAGETGPVLRTARALLEPGSSLSARSAQRAGLRLDGADTVRLVAAAAAPRPAPVIEQPGPRPSTGQAEREYWATVERFDTRTGYEAYLNRYPNGTYAATARARISSITDDPLRAPREAEAALNLSREQRRGIQADLVTLGFDTRGVDGIFGNGTRAAVRSWQSREGARETGYLDADQIALLDRQAARRQAELDIEAERRRAQLEAADRAFWDETGRGRDAAGLRRYLERFPDGRFAEQAEANLAAIAEENRAASAAEDRAAFERAQQVGTAEAYRRYLSAFPQGAYVAQANQAIEATQVDQAAVAAENALGLDPVARRLVEVGLRQAGYDPGATDGRIDESTRRAIRRYQRDRGIPVTGYLSQAVVVRMVAESFLK